MRFAKEVLLVVLLVSLVLPGSVSAQFTRVSPQMTVEGAPPVTTPPQSFFQMIEQRVSRSSRRGRRGAAADQDRPAGEAAQRTAAEIKIYRDFYKKYIDVKGMPVVASAEVSDLALQRTYDIVTHMLAGRPDILQAMVESDTYLIIIGKDQVYTDMPEYRNHPNPDFQNERVRGTGGNPTSFGEENLLSLPLDRYDDESIGVHEFCHTIDSALGRIDPTWRGRLRATYDNAVEKGLFRNTYAGGNTAEYWAEMAQAYFDNNRVNNWNHGPIGRREQLKEYDPAGYELVRTTFNLSPEQDWRYQWLRELPNVTTPPAKFAIDPYYTKFTWAREFTVVGRQASDEAMLKANDTIRKMFAYRHDILKAFIADGVKLVVLGPDERIADLPEYKRLSDPTAVDALARYLTYTPELKLLVVGQENVLADPSERYVGDNQVIRVFADAICKVTGTRPVDPEWENRPRSVWQQYELGLTRLDERFDARVRAIYDYTMSQGKWIGSSSVNNHVAYWTAGVLAYFDAAGQDDTPADAAHPIRTRESLAQYDPELFALVNETMAYENQIDWRYEPCE